MASRSSRRTEVVPPAKLPEDSATWMVSVEPVFPVVIDVAVLVLDGDAHRDRAAGSDVAGWAVMTSLFSRTGFTVKVFVVADVDAAIGRVGRRDRVAPAVVIWRPLKFATPLTAATEVVPAAKEPEDSATWMVSVEPVFPVVIDVAVLVLDGDAHRDRAPGGDRAGGLGGDDQLVLGRPG